MVRLLGASMAVIVAVLALVFAVGFAVILKLHLNTALTMSLAGGFALLVVLIQYAISPWLLDTFIKVRWANPRELGDEFDQWLRSTCQTFKIPSPRFGIIEEAAPNAFTYGHGPYDARVVVTRGLVDVLEPEELKAVVAHELGHIRHRDFIVMTVVQALVLVLYSLYIASRTNTRNNAYIAIFAYFAYWASYYASLLLSRIREYMADYASAQIMQDANPLSHALVKISYGLARTQTVTGQTNPVPQAPPRHAPATAMAGPQFASAQQPDKAMQIMMDFQNKQKQDQPKPKKNAFSAASLGAFGIAGASSMRCAVAWFGAAGAPDPANFLAAARWELYNPWGRLAELVSTHPLTALRIKALQKLNRLWGVKEDFDFSQVKPGHYRRFVTDLLVLLMPFLIATAAGVLSYVSHQMNGAQVLFSVLAGYFGGMDIEPDTSTPSKNRLPVGCTNSNAL